MNTSPAYSQSDSAHLAGRAERLAQAKAFEIKRDRTGRHPSPNDLDPMQRAAGNQARDQRLAEMADFIRLRLCQSDGITESDLRAAGFKLAEVTEYGDEAFRAAKAAIDGDGDKVRDLLPAVIAKALAANATAMPITAGALETPTLQNAWIAYCLANAAHALDPWVAQAERAFNQLDRFLSLLPLLAAERNKVINQVALDLKKRGSGNRQKGGAA